LDADKLKDFKSNDEKVDRRDSERSLKEAKDHVSKRIGINALFSLPIDEWGDEKQKEEYVKTQDEALFQFCVFASVLYWVYDWKNIVSLIYRDSKPLGEIICLSLQSLTCFIISVFTILFYKRRKTE
jgi:hypothetical protein